MTWLHEIHRRPFTVGLGFPLISLVVSSSSLSSVNFALGFKSLRNQGCLSSESSELETNMIPSVEISEHCELLIYLEHSTMYRDSPWGEFALIHWLRTRVQAWSSDPQGSWSSSSWRVNFWACDLATAPKSPCPWNLILNNHVMVSNTCRITHTGTYTCLYFTRWKCQAFLKSVHLVYTYINPCRMTYSKYVKRYKQNK